jgi:hypothetical protein
LEGSISATKHLLATSEGTILIYAEFPVHISTPPQSAAAVPSTVGGHGAVMIYESWSQTVLAVIRTAGHHYNLLAVVEF